MLAGIVARRTSGRASSLRVNHCSSTNETAASIRSREKMQRAPPLGDHRVSQCERVLRARRTINPRKIMQNRPTPLGLSPPRAPLIDWSTERNHHSTHPPIADREEFEQSPLDLRGSRLPFHFFPPAMNFFFFFSRLLRRCKCRNDIFFSASSCSCSSSSWARSRGVD